MDKSALRAELKRRRARAAAQLPKAGEALAARVPNALLELKPAIVAGYVPIGDEIEPGAALYRFRQAGARLALPVIHLQTKALSFRAWDFGQTLKPGPFQIPQPTEEAETLTPDLLLIPLLGWSQEGGRLGWGQGHYDRSLTPLRAAGAVTAVGLGFECQRVWDLPQEPHDEPLDWILTESAAYEAVTPAVTA